MERFVLAAVLLLSGVSAAIVSISHSPPFVKLFLPVTTPNITEVTFHYFLQYVSHQGKGQRTSNGWELTVDDSSLHKGDLVQAYAVVDEKGTQYTTRLGSWTYGSTTSDVAVPPRRVRGAVFFRDDFDSLNKANWDIEVSMYGGWNGEFQVYTNDPKNVFTRGGNLFLYPTPTANDPRFSESFLHTGTMDMKTLFGYCSEPAVNGCTRSGRDGLLPPIMSGKVNSVPTMKYGTLEVRARVPKGNWLWPAIWMLPKNSVYGSSPRSGEIDVMEFYDFLPHSVYTTLHWGPSGDQNGFLKTKGEVDGSNWHDSFHTWKMDWTPDHINIFLDNKQVVHVDPGSGGFWQFGGFSGSNIWRNGGKMAPFDQPFYLILNVAVGGTSGAFPDGINYGSIRKPWSNSSPRAAEEFWNAHNDWLPSWQGDNAALQVDYVEFRNL